jgi:hypothetical protein
LKDASSRVFGVCRCSTFAITSPRFVRTTTRSPRLILAHGLHAVAGDLQRIGIEVFDSRYIDMVSFGKIRLVKKSRSFFLLAIAYLPGVLLVAKVVGQTGKP